VREIHQHHALRAIGLGLQDVEQLPRAAVDRVGQRNALDQRFEPAQHALADDASRHHAREQDHRHRRQQGQRGLYPRLRQPGQRRIAVGQVLQHGPISGG
jgi:hypothetical protein